MRQSKSVIHKVSVAVTVNTTAYTAGDALHAGVITLEKALQYNGSGLIVGATVIDQAKQSDALSLIIFEETPSNTTVTINAALDIADADMSKIAGVVGVAAADYTDFNDNSFATASAAVPISKGIVSSTGRDLYLVAMAGGTPSFAAATDLTVTLYIKQD